MLDPVLTVVLGTAIVLGDEWVGIDEDSTHCDSIDAEILEEIVAGNLPSACPKAFMPLSCQRLEFSWSCLTEQ